MTEYTEDQLNQDISSILDSPKTSIRTKAGSVSLRDILTAVHRAQQRDTRWLSKIFGKKSVDQDTVLQFLSEEIQNHVNLLEDGHYTGFYTQVSACLEMLSLLGLVKESLADSEWFSDDLQTEYAVTSYGKAFVNYYETEKE
jgi:hypothetical protein